MITVEYDSFQSSTYRGVECDTLGQSYSAQLSYAFSPLLIEEWSVTGVDLSSKEVRPGSAQLSYAFSPLLIEEWSVT